MNLFEVKNDLKSKVEPDVLEFVINKARTDAAIEYKLIEAVENQDEQRIAQLIQMTLTLKDIPANYTKGNFFAEGGTSVLYEMNENSNLLIKKGGGRFSVEAASLVELAMAGIPTVYVGQRHNEIIVTKILGVGSKDIIGRQKQPKRVLEKAKFVTDKTVADLDDIFEVLQKNSLNVGDFQFIVRESDGTVFINDPVSVTKGKGPSGKIRQIIEIFKGIANKNRQP